MGSCLKKKQRAPGGPSTSLPHPLTFSCFGFMNEGYQYLGYVSMRSGLPRAQTWSPWATFGWIGCLSLIMLSSIGKCEALSWKVGLTEQSSVEERVWGRGSPDFDLILILSSLFSPIVFSELPDMFLVEIPRDDSNGNDSQVLSPRLPHL